MKLCLILVACLGVSLAVPRIHPRVDKLHQPRHISQRDLLQDLLDIVGAVHLDQLLEILDAHLVDDPAICAIINYLKSDPWNELIAEVGALQGIVDLIAYLNEKGVPVEVLLGAIQGVIDAAVPGVEGDNTASLQSFLDEVLSVISLTDLVALLNDKLQNSVDFQDLYTTLSSEGKPWADQILTMAEVDRLEAILTAMGVTIAEIENIVYGFLGWGEAPLKLGQRDLNSDIMDVIALIPIETVIRILEEHVETDPAVTSVISYLQSDAASEVVAQIVAIQGIANLGAYLEMNGVAVDLLFGAVTGIIDALVPGVEGDNTASLRPFFDHLEGELPLTEIMALINDKLQNSADVQALYAMIATPEGKAAVDELRAIPEVVRIGEVLRGQEARVDEFWAALYEFFGW